MKVLSLFDGKYKVYEDGTIVSYARKQPKEIKGKITNNGYRMVLLHDRIKKRHYITVHRVVASLFIENPMLLPEVNHKDGNKLNNHASNLEWVTTKENLLHCRDTLGSKANKITFQDAEKIRKLKANGVSNKEITSIYGIHKTQISYIIQGKRWCAYEAN